MEPQELETVTQHVESLRTAVDEELGDDFELDVYFSHLGIEGRTRLFLFGKCRDVAQYGELRERIDSSERLRGAFESIALRTVSSSNFQTLLVPIAAGASKKSYGYRMRRTARMTNSGNATNAARRLTDYLNAKYAEKVTVSAFHPAFGAPDIIHFFVDLESYAAWQELEGSFRVDKKVQSIMRLAEEAVDSERDVMMKRL